MSDAYKGGNEFETRHLVPVDHRHFQTPHYLKIILLIYFIQISNIYMYMYISSNTCQIKDQFINMTKNAQAGPHQSVLCPQSFVYKITW